MSKLLKQAGIAELVERLWWQKPTWPVTFGTAPCGHSGRGGDYCADCIAAELKTRIPAEKVDAFIVLIDNHRDATVAAQTMRGELSDE